MEAYRGSAIVLTSVLLEKRKEARQKPMTFVLVKEVVSILRRACMKTRYFSVHVRDTAV